jgi:RecB family exonuclease
MSLNAAARIDQPPSMLTPAQRRTLDQLIGRGPPPPQEPALGAQIRQDMEARMVAGGLGRAVAHRPDRAEVWLSKNRLNDRERCEGLFRVRLFGEAPPFQHTPRTAGGSLFHKAIEIDVITERRADPATICGRASERLATTDTSFGDYWSRTDPLVRAEVLADAAGRLSLFRDSFPPLQRRWSPQPELRLRAVLAGGRVVLTGAPDLVLGRTRRLVVDFKSGGAWPEHPEDMRFYALLLLLRTGVAPYRVATFFLDSGEWQAEDVTDEILRRAADRVVDASTAALRLFGGRAPQLSPGRHCGWCPVRSDCPAVMGVVPAGPARFTVDPNDVRATR